MFIKCSLLEIFNVVGRAKGLVAEELRWWNIEKVGKSKILKENKFNKVIMGSDYNKLKKSKWKELSVGKLWVYTSREYEGKQLWTIITFASVSAGKQYYDEVKNYTDLTSLMVFYEGKQVFVDAEGFDLYEVNYMNGVSNFFNTVEEVAAELIRYNNLEDRTIKDTSSIKVYRKGKEFPYSYRDNVVEWL